MGFLCELGFRKVSGQRPAAIAGEETDGDPQQSPMKWGLGEATSLSITFAKKRYAETENVAFINFIGTSTLVFPKLRFVRNADTQHH